MVSAVILAAGAAKRMGKPKQLLPLGHKPMVWWVANAACQSHVSEVLLVTGAYNNAVADAVRDLPVQVIVNTDWQQGQSTSVKKGVEAVRAGAKAVLFLLADQPLVSADLMNQILAVYDTTAKSIILPVFQTRRGNPVLFDLTCWREKLLQLEQDKGARDIIVSHPEEVATVQLESETVFCDVDTIADYKAMQILWKDNNRGRSCESH